MIDLYRNPAPALHCLSSCYVLPRFWPTFRRQTSNPDREGYDGERKKAVLIDRSSRYMTLGPLVGLSEDI
jgi:hypothetical protein